MKMLHVLNRLVLMGLATFTCMYAFADSSVTEPSAFLAQVMSVIQSFGGLSMMLKIAAIITLIVSSMKVTLLNDLIWKKLGALQVWVAPVLGLVGGLLSLGSGITLASAFAYMSAGAGAVILHELLDTIKAIPGIGELWVSVIGIIEGVLGGPSSKA